MKTSNSFMRVAAMHTDVNPVGWKVGSAYVVRHGRGISARISPVPELVAYQEALREAVRPQWARPPLNVPCRIDTLFWRQQPSYVNEAGRKVTKHVQDLDNLRKSTIDALEGVVIANDRLVVQGWMEIVEQSPNTDPRIEIAVWLL